MLFRGKSWRWTCHFLARWRLPTFYFPEQASEPARRLWGKQFTQCTCHNTYELLIIEARLDWTCFYFHCKEIPSIISLIGIENLCVLEYDAVFLNWNEQNEREIVMIPAYSRQINHDFSRFLFLPRKMKYTDSPCSQFWVQSVVLCHSSILLYSFLKFCFVFPTCTNFFLILPSPPLRRIFVNFNG